ncbi:MAG: TIGR01777 family oxidoreductase [Candidatus Poseidonia sp.]|nr:TIGR01777 family oxidoreductase [Poseidonia sp.]
MPRYQHTATFDAPVEEVWAWYDSPGAFRRVMPEWEGITPLQAGALVNEARTKFKVSLGPMKRLWVARHYNVIHGEVFHDVMEKGPFGAWDHEHRFVPTGENTSEIHDIIDWKLPLHPLTFWTAPFTVKGRMKQMFAYRSTRVQSDLARIREFSHLPRHRILISGSTGLIGMQLCAFLSAAGHDVTRLVRPSTTLPSDAVKENTVVWNDQTGEVISGSLDGFDTVIHLAGAGIGDRRWNAKRKELISKSRSIPTRNLAEHLARCENPPATFISGSATGFYGNRFNETLDESSEAGKNYLATICQEWESAAQPAADAGIRTVWIRTGLVVTPMGGALKKLLLPSQLGGGGPVAGGRQYYSWISLDDQIYAIHHLMMTQSCSGPFNLTAPTPVTQKIFAKTLGRVLRRPAFMPLPGFVLKIMFGEMGKALVIDGQRVLPKRLEEIGYRFEHQDLESCLRQCLGKQRLP